MLRALKTRTAERTRSQRQTVGFGRLTPACHSQPVHDLCRGHWNPQAQIASGTILGCGTAVRRSSLRKSAAGPFKPPTSVRPFAFVRTVGLEVVNSRVAAVSNPPVRHRHGSAVPKCILRPGYSREKLNRHCIQQPGHMALFGRQAVLGEPEVRDIGSHSGLGLEQECLGLSAQEQLLAATADQRPDPVCV